MWRGSPGAEKEERKGVQGLGGRCWCLGRGRTWPRVCPWQRANRVTPDSALQTGSYFGASLCSVDVNGDSSSDLVLIGAPHFYEQTHGGQVSVCPFPQGVSSDETWAGWGLAVGWRGPWGRT